MNTVINDDFYANSVAMNKKPVEYSYIPTKVDVKSLSELKTIQKMILTTDGTVTDLLEHYFEEEIQTIKLYEAIEEDFKLIPDNHRVMIEDDIDDNVVLLRKIILKGKSSLDSYLYAESSILVNHLPQDFHDDLVNSNAPIGKLWAKHRFETFKSDYVVTKEKANEETAKHLSLPVNSDIFSRTYCVYSNGKKAMIITEKFSADNF